MGLFRSMAGVVRLELTSADKEAALRQISAYGIEIEEVVNRSELSVEFTVSRVWLSRLQEMARKKGERLIILRRGGLFWPVWSLRRRPLLVAGLGLLLYLSISLPGRVLFVQVEGNDKVPEQLILEAAQDAGIRFGASRRAVRSEKMKNELLGVLPQLQWAGVNTYGCTAVISVRERAAETVSPSTPMVSSIVASCDGVITDCTAKRGSLLCTVGQAVQKGQVLISGYMDNGLSVTATRAAGEVFAQTQHEITGVLPFEILARGETTDLKRNFSLILGKKRINFTKGSGIYDDTCVKMCTEYCLTLPGGFALPVMLVIETVAESDVQIRSFAEDEAQRLLSDSAKEYLLQQLVASTIVDLWEDFSCEDGAYRLSAHYACREMIGREQSEQIGDFHGKTD